MTTDLGGITPLKIFSSDPVTSMILVEDVRTTLAPRTASSPMRTPSTTMLREPMKAPSPMITGLARLDGWPVAILASDPNYYGGAWTAHASEKAMRFVDLAETFHLPVVCLADIPGFLIGRDAEEAATIRHGVRAMAAIAQATMPWCAVLVRKVYGVAGAAHMNSSRFNLRYAWPSGDWGSLPIAGGLEAAYRAELEAADDPEAKLKEIEERLERYRSPFRTAEPFLVEEIIDPRDTRVLLCEWVELVYQSLGTILGPKRRGTRA